MQLSPTSSPLTRSHDDRSHDDGERGQSTERRIKALIVAAAFPDDVVELLAPTMPGRMFFAEKSASRPTCAGWQTPAEMSLLCVSLGGRRRAR
jgi:hypothetical protein